ncbi:hypothetical protein DXB61_04440 [Parabacteroides merdae]|uniref:DUF6383 domain-containing protein n=2 Tax=Parabacteroides merdae TaxID=46503 RepID=A0AB37LYD1_9BACT|nr:hypothetical protein DXB61_04440 [Parabacteroides merdae]
MTAALLMAGPAFNAAYAGAVTPVAYSSVAGNTKLANGMKFYLKAGWVTSGDAFATVKEVTLSDNKTKVWTIAGETETDIAKAAVFEVADFQKVGQKYTFTLKVDGKPIYLGTGGTVSANVDAKTITSTMIVASDKLAELAKITPVLDGDNVTENELSAYTTSEEYSAEDLNDYNLNGFTFTFEAKEGTELEGNTFANPMYAVNVGSDLYFVDVNGSDAKALKALKEKASVTLSDLENSKLKVLALNSDSKYGTSGEKKTAYKILTIAGDKIGDDKNNDAKFTVTEFDQLANEGEFEIKATVSGTSYQIGAIRFTTSDTKTYVTTVDEADKAKIAKATLGTNSYLDASVLLKEDAMNVVNIYFTSNEKSWNDEEGAQREYHKYLVADGSSAGLVALAQNHVDFTSPLAQWIVSDFDGKYTFTLTNRETGKTLGLRLAEDGKEGGYEVVGTVTGGYTAISTGVTSSTPISGTSVKFNTIPTTQYDSYRLFTEEEMEAGIALVFSGKNAVIGERDYYASIANGKVVPSRKESEIALFYPERVKAAADPNKGKENYVLDINEYAYLNEDGEVATGKDTLIVPTYRLATAEDKYWGANASGSDDAKYALADAAVTAATEWAFVMTANGEYSLAEVKRGTNGSAQYSDVTASKVWGVKGVNTSTIGFNMYNHYNNGVVVDEGFANLTILVNDNSDKSHLVAESRHASFDNKLGSIAMQLNANGINEGILNSEGMVFWLDTVGNETPAFYISRGVEGQNERLFMYNATDSMKIFDEGEAQEYFNEAYVLEGTYDESGATPTGDAKVIFRPAVLVDNDTLTTTVGDKLVSVVAKDADITKDQVDGLKAFQFGICLADEDVEGEYIVYNGSKYVYALNGKLGLTSDPQKAMVFTLGDETPTANEGVEVSEVKVIAGEGNVMIAGAQGKKVVISNILGQVVANTVIASDNATIAAPAGVVVVAVEGEAAVKAIVK